MPSKKASRKQVPGNSGEKKEDTSPYISQNPKINFELNIRVRHELTEKQKAILVKMEAKDTKIVNVDALWGTSKSYCAVLAALNLLKEGKTRKIYYIRNAVEASDCAKIGLLPGEAGDKTALYNEVLFEKLHEFIPEPQIKKLIEGEYIECLAPNYLRGRSFNNCTLICDEAANFSFATFLLIVSRMGERTRAFFLGDSEVQTDIKNSGFKEFCRSFDDEESQEHGVWNFEMRDPNDILRSGFLRFAMEKLGVAKKSD
jgi:phosphate starvation-inducible protein PhoH